MRLLRTKTQAVSRRAAISAPALLIIAFAAVPAAAHHLAAGMKRAAAAAASDVITVIAVKGFKFIPNTVRAKAGVPLTIVFKNEGALSHNLTIFATLSGSQILAHTPTIQRGTQATLRFDPEKAGTYPFWCTVPGHKEAGMRGSVIVQ